MKIVAGVLLAIVIIIAVNAVLQTGQETEKQKLKDKLKVIPGKVGAGAGGGGGGSW